MSSQRKVRIGIVGLRLGQWHIETIGDLPGARVGAISELISGKLPDMNWTLEEYAAQLGAEAYTDGVDMINNADIDAVSICVSPKYRLPLVEAAAARGLPMLIEKPFGSNMAHGEAIAEVIQNSGVMAMSEFPLRYFPPLVELKKLLDDGTLGKPFMLSADIVMPGFARDWPQHWMWDPNNGNGVINENTCHVFDTVCFLLGEPVALHAYGGNFHGTAAVPDGAVMAIRFANGAVASVIGGALGPLQMPMDTWLDLFTENGQALVTGTHHMYDTLKWATHDQQGEPSTQTWPNPPRRQIMRYSMQHFIDCVREGRQPTCDLRDGMRALAMAMAVNESIETGKEVELKVESFAS